MSDPRAKSYPVIQRRRRAVARETEKLTVSHDYHVAPNTV